MSNSIKYPMIRFVEFNSPRYKNINNILVSNSVSKSFFYITYHYSEFRYVFGRPFSYWSKSDTSIENIISGIENKFRSGSKISIFFNLGLFIRIAGTSSDEATGIRIEQEYGYDTSIANSQIRLNSLVSRLDFFRSKRSTKDCINWANNNITNFGEWRDTDTFKINKNPQILVNFKFRKSNSMEKEFIENKITKKYYCENVTSNYFAGSDPYRLYMKPKIITRDSILILPSSIL